MRARKLRLYVWEGVFADWSSGIGFALAYDADHARRLILKSRGFQSKDDEKDLAAKPRVYSRPHGGSVSGGG